jgi:hypothetical protein
VQIRAVQDGLLETDSGAELKPVILPTPARLAIERQAGESETQENDPKKRNTLIHFRSPRFHKSHIIPIMSIVFVV